MPFGTARPSLTPLANQSDEAGLEPTPPPVSNVVADGTLAMIAGADTTATGISSFFYLILSHPKKYKKLQAEIDKVYSKDEDESAVLDSSRHGQLVYLTACLYVNSRTQDELPVLISKCYRNETLRLLPPAPTNGPRELPRGSGGRIMGGR